MRLRKILKITATAVGIIAVIIGGYIYWQYRTARPPTLDSMPIYSARVAVPITDITEPQRTAAEQELRNLAATTQPGYQVAEERLLATKGPFTWDALRHNIESCLGGSYKLAKARWSTDHTIIYHVYGHGGGLRRKFNDDKILVAGLHTTMRTVTGDEVHLYGYFRLTPS